MKNMKWEEDYLRPKSVIVPLPTYNRFASKRKIRVFFSSRDYKRSIEKRFSGSAKHSHGVSRSHERAFTRYLYNSPYKDKLFFVPSLSLFLSLSTPINFVLAAPDRHAPLRLIRFHAEQRAKKRGYRVEQIHG